MDMQEVEGLNKAASLLTAVGSGNYDYDTWECTLGESNVYAFDMEVYNISQLYFTVIKTGQRNLREEQDWNWRIENGR